MIFSLWTSCGHSCHLEWRGHSETLSRPAQRSINSGSFRIAATARRLGKAGSGSFAPKSASARMFVSHNSRCLPSPELAALQHARSAENTGPFIHPGAQTRMATHLNRRSGRDERRRTISRCCAIDHNRALKGKTSRGDLERWARRHRLVGSERPAHRP